VRAGFPLLLDAYGGRFSGLMCSPASHSRLMMRIDGH
jgi:hypothetical protein